MTKAVSRLLAIILAVILAAATYSLFVTATYAYDRDRGNDGDRTEIEVENEGTSVSNDVSVSANTGKNDANGGDSRQGGEQAGMPRPGGLSLQLLPPMSGGGGSAGSGGDGGTIVTGDATAYGTVMNDVNNNRVVVEGCGCDEDYRPDFLHFFSRDNDKKLEIEVENEGTSVENDLRVKANTGRNDANGGDSRGGASYNPWMMWFGHHTGDNDGGNGGTIRTGVAYADGLVTNVLNRNVVRVLNGVDQGNND